ncbi:YeeE/YedE family protein [Roseovarius sp. 2305UL8-3]|uniref:YeeE/YedE family protein n=1 Tax=Roseovarius conchicola TaxID=3121636 RepID=UPI0035276CF6
MLEGISDAALVALIGFGGGLLLGLAARIGRFCTLGAIEDTLYQGSSIRLRMWGVAIGVSVLAVFALTAAGQFDPSQSIYHLAPWSPFASIFGGLLFGYGMSLAGTCGFGALARLGGGDLRSFVIVLVMGIAGYVMLSGPLAGMRVSVVAATDLQNGPVAYSDLLSRITGLAPPGAGLLIGVGILVTALWSAPFLTNRSALFWGTVVGLTIVSGWIGTQWVSQHGFAAQPVLSHTFAAPLGETTLFLMTSSGGGLSFGVGSVFGVLAGAFCGSLIKGHFRWEACEDPRELKRQILGAVCMGFGAVLAFGCTIGQGISAFSVLSLSAPITFAAIFAGAALGLRQLITGFASS